MQVFAISYVFDAGGIWFALIILLAGVALGAFIAIQLWLESPRRREFNNAWFAQFEAHLRACYSQGELSWRTLDIKSHFDPSLH